MSGSIPRDTLATAQTGERRSPLRARYLALFREGTSQVIGLPDEGDLVVGRGDECGLRLEDPKISRKHLRFELAGDRAVVTDLESQNGTFVNGARLEGSHRLVSGDVIEIGRSALVFHSAPGSEGAETSFDRLQSELEHELARAVRSGRALAVIAIEGTSETVLTVIGEELVGLERAARADVDRVVIVLPETGSEQAESRADAMLHALRERGVAARAGVACYPRDACEAGALVAAARDAVAQAAAGSRRGACALYRTLELGSVTVVVADPAMQRLYDLIERLAASDLPVLVHGETGSGKELAARALHHASKRAPQRLVAINCAALHESLVESELFGHQKGAFTGASQAKAGYLEAASGGTVFFDEIGELPLAIQAKLLRALDTRTVIRVGEVHERPIDVRVVAATNRNLEQEVAAQRFRQDLYFRLSGATLWVPPLRDRPRELAILAKRALDRARTGLEKPAMRISDGAMQLLAAHSWPGNVRELGNVMEFAAAAFDGPVLEPWHLEARIAGGAAEAAAPAPSDAGFRSLDDEIRELEQSRIVAALEASGEIKSALLSSSECRFARSSASSRSTGSGPHEAEYAKSARNRAELA